LDGTSISDIEDAAEYSSDAAKMDYVYNTNGGFKQLMERKMRENFMSNDHVVEQMKRTIDSLPGVGNGNFGAEDYITSYDDSGKLAKGDISIDQIAEEYFGKAHEYGKKDEKGVDNFDNDDPEKVAKETEEIRDKSNDPKEKFRLSFAFH
jgi:hypothetical protein